MVDDGSDVGSGDASAAEGCSSSGLSSGEGCSAGLLELDEEAGGAAELGAEAAADG